MSDTPRTDNARMSAQLALELSENPPTRFANYHSWVRADIAAQLERELAEAAAKLATRPEEPAIEHLRSPCPHGKPHELNGNCAGCDCGRPTHTSCCRFVAAMLRGPMRQPAAADRVLELVAECEARAALPRLKT